MVKTTRKEVLKQLRAHIDIEQERTYSDPRACGQRVKFWICKTNINLIKHVLENLGFENITVTEANRNSYFRSVALFFPYELYN